MRSYDVFIHEINDIRRWLFTTIYAYKQTSNVLSMKIENDCLSEEQISEAFDEQGCNSANLMRRLQLDNIKTSKELALIRSISALEIFLVDSVQEVFNSNKTPFMENGKIEWPVGELLSCEDISLLHEKYIRGKCRNLHSGGFEEIQKYYKKVFATDFSTYCTQIDGKSYGLPFITQYHQRRHLIVHRLGKTDEQYRKKYNTGELTIRLNEEDLSAFFQVLNSFGGFIERHLSSYILTEPKQNVVEIVFEIVDDSVAECIEPAYEIKIKKDHTIPLSMILKSKEELFNDVYKVVLNGSFQYMRRYYKKLQKFESAGKIKGLQISCVSQEQKQRKHKQYPWNEVEMVIALLPERPWKKNIHKEIARHLGWSNNKVSGIIDYIINETNVSISLDRKRLELPQGETFSFTPSLKPAGFAGTISWQSSNPNIVDVDNATITAVSQGTAYITARVIGTEAKDVCYVMVEKNSSEK
nr:Ig-like domain-containing protein [uncultured Butyrivibrio sp.]